jgi:hypothetical protein
MLKISLHYATPHTVNDRNVLGRLDIAYAKLDARADYKALMFITGVGELAPIRLDNYPRWSASIWDLVARVICLGLSHTEALGPADLPYVRKCAFIDDMTAVIEHCPDGSDSRRAVIATAHVRGGKRKGHYTATFTSDLHAPMHSTVFVHTPLGLSPWDLLARAYAWTVHERFELPSRPELYTPIPVQRGEQSYVALETVREPARTGILRWLHKRAMSPTALDLVCGPCVTEPQFVEFLRKAI